jgi:Tfp pilus assembly protein PilO
MNRMRTWSLGAAGLALLILVAGWFLLISPAKTKVSDLNSQTAAQQQTNAGLQVQINQLKLANKNLPEQEAELAKIRQHLPANPELPAYIRTLTEMAHEAGVKLVSVGPAAPAPVVVATPAVVAPATTTASPSASPSASASTGGDGTAADAPVAPAAPTAPSSPLRMIPVSINITGGYFNVVSFLNKVENMKRSMLVYSIGVTPVGADATASSTTTTTKVTAVLNTRIFYSPPVETTPVTTPATGTAPTAAAAPTTAS